MTKECGAFFTSSGSSALPFFAFKIPLALTSSLCQSNAYLFLSPTHLFVFKFKTSISLWLNWCSETEWQTRVWDLLTFVATIERNARRVWRTTGDAIDVCDGRQWRSRRLFAAHHCHPYLIPGLPAIPVIALTFLPSITLMALKRNFIFINPISFWLIALKCVTGVNKH